MDKINKKKATAMEESYRAILKNSSLLLVEDDKRVGESFAKVLRLYLKEVFLAHDGEEGFRLYKEKNPDILITDVRMPKLNGIELIKKIRRENSKIPIIITSAYSDQDYLLEAIKLSLIEYIIKPMKEEDLKRVLKESAKQLSNSSNLFFIQEGLFYDYKNKIFIRNGKKVTLTKKEIELVELLLLNRGNLVTKEKIENTLYSYEEAPPSALKNIIFKLRKKLPNDIIKTYGKLGYFIEKE
ncbi:MAG: response regulator transcription factor [Epsilonproteobacteria bacterium]|nr:response regulator transcription factor [Campylobacterota bacterium]